MTTFKFELGASEDDNVFINVEVKAEDHRIQVDPKQENKPCSNLHFQIFTIGSRMALFML